MGRATDSRTTGAHPAPLDRRPELELLRAALADVRRGRGRCITVAGEPGIGKTTLLDALATDAQAEGALVLWGHCWEAGGAPGFWPWTQIVSALLQSHGDALIDALGPAADWLTQLAPDHAPPRSPSAIAMEGEQARFALFDAVAALLREAGGSGPLMVVLEDVHATDLGSLRLLQALADDLGDCPVLLIASFRDLEVRRRPEVAELLAQVSRLGDAIELRGLSPGALQQLIAARIGADVAAGTAATLHRFTAGNPLYADEIIRVLAGEDSLKDLVAGEPLALPRGVAETIRRRLGPLTVESTPALLEASVVGREFRLRTLEQIVDADRAALVAQLESAILAGVVVADENETGRYRFAHALFREALYDDLPEAERAQVHGDIGSALELIYGDTVERHLAEVAHHYLSAAPQSGTEKAIEFATRAGHRAMRSLAYEQGAYHFQRALGVLELLAVDDDRRGPLLLALGHARMKAGDTAAGRSALLEAAELARATGDAEALARAALGMAARDVTPTADEELVGVLEESLQALGADNPALRSRLLARLAAAMTWAPNVQRRRSAAIEALTLSQDHGGRRTRGFVLTQATAGLVEADYLAERMTNSEELAALAAATGELEWAILAQMHRVSCALERGDGPGVRADVDALQRLIDRTQQPRLRWVVPSHRALLAGIEGRWEEYETLAAQALKLGTDIPGTVAPIVHSAQLLTIRWVQGQLAEMQELITQVAATFPTVPAWQCALTLAYAESGRDARARSSLALLATDDFAVLPHNHTRLTSAGLLVDACVALDEPAYVTALAAILAPFAGRHIATAQGTYGGPVNRHLGQLAALGGRLDEALDAFALARTEAQRMNSPPFVARTSLDHGIALARAGEAVAAGRQLARAQHEAIELSMPRAATRAGELLQTLADSPGAVPWVAPGASVVPTAAAQDDRALLRREGDVWTLRYEQRTVRVKDSKGLHHLAVLLAAPDVEIHALDLVGGIGVAAAASSAAAAEAGLSSDTGDGAGPLLDEQAKREYRTRMTDLQADIDEATAFNDPERAARAREELDFVARELARAVGLGGRDRQTASNAERARVNATRAIRSTIRRIAELDAALGHELDSTVRTGTFCVYIPDPRRPVSWRVEDG